LYDGGLLGVKGVPDLGEEGVLARIHPDTGRKASLGVKELIDETMPDMGIEIAILKTGE
jgi:hypothetical protein